MASVLRATVVTAVRVADAADLAAQKLVDETFQNRSLWTLKSIMSTAGMGKFSTDRT
jgi:glucan phosphorylase